MLNSILGGGSATASETGPGSHRSDDHRNGELTVQHARRLRTSLGVAIGSEAAPK
jgi:hypothetical protein